MTVDGQGGEGASTNAVDAGASDLSQPFTLPESFEDNIDDIEVPEEPSTSGDGAAAPPAHPGAAAPQAQPAAQPGQQQPPAAAAVAPQQQPAQVQPQQPGQPTQAGDSTQRVYAPAELAQMLGSNRAQIIDALAAQKFGLSTAEVQALEVDAVGVLPKIMARVYFEATVNGLQQMANMVPRMVENVVTTRIEENSAEDAFHRTWPNIDRQNQQHMRVVDQLANSFRQMNPAASQADAIRYVGMAATTFLGLPMPQQRASPGNGAGRQPAAMRRGGPAFAPAAAGTAQPPPGMPTGPSNPFDGLGLTYDE